LTPFPNPKSPAKKVVDKDNGDIWKELHRQIIESQTHIAWGWPVAVVADSEK